MSMGKALDSVTANGQGNPQAASSPAGERPAENLISNERETAGPELAGVARPRLPARASGDESLPAPADVHSRNILGVPIAMIDYKGAMDVMDGMVARRERGYVCAVAVHAVMVSRRDPEMRAAVRGSSLTVPDGMPLVWAANALGEDLDNRVYGPELMDRYSARCAEKRHRVWLYGGRDQGSLMQLALNMRRRHPGIEIVGGYSPPFRPLTGEEEDALVEQINEARPDVLWVGIGVPKQEKWMAHMRERLDVPVMCAVGAAFDFHSGRISQAPGWMQARGLEWIYRIAQEPRRLLPRYVLYNPAFLLAFARQFVGEKLGRRR
jgi:N-acetylglucosaminyldiphosphoundecaprenol N-acetyl-beta-D-mannosaminyltransferase